METRYRIRIDDDRNEKYRFIVWDTYQDVQICVCITYESAERNADKLNLEYKKEQERC